MKQLQDNRDNKLLIDSCSLEMIKTASLYLINVCKEKDVLKNASEGI
jgi:hypothetical protein